MTAVVALSGISKAYGALRPLRIEHLIVSPGEQVAILGFDQPSAEVFVNLITGATLPDSGDVTVFGRQTSAIADGADWLATVDRFGIVSPRAVLLDALSVIQNLAVPFTLAIEPPADEVRVRAEALAQETGIPRQEWDRRIAELPHASRARVRLGRAVALDPQVLLAEHPSAEVPLSDVAALGRTIRDVAARRGAALIVATADPTLAKAAAGRVLTLDPATGRLKGRWQVW